tara:strand:- start:409 stop:585 length:177 start_codon:yes stop_codon:yes gene_type:complete
MLSKIFLIKQGKCCGHKCLMCPYENKHSGKSKKLRKGILENLDNWEKKELDLTENTNQ